jgi:hypothetical protein
MNNTSHTLTIGAGSGGVDYYGAATGSPDILSNRARWITFYITSSSSYDYYFHI